VKNSFIYLHHTRFGSLPNDSERDDGIFIKQSLLLPGHHHYQQSHLQMQHWFIIVVWRTVYCRQLLMTSKKSEMNKVRHRVTPSLNPSMTPGFKSQLLSRKRDCKCILPLNIPVAARSKAWVCGRSFAGIACSNPTGDMEVCLL
jgi:hypothetical protein